jgi:hypothetical protein
MKIPVNQHITATLTALALLLSVSSRVDAQTTEPQQTVGDDFYRNTYFAIGLNAGLLSGAGLSARASFPGGLTGQTTFFVMTFGQYLHFNIGGEIQYAFDRGANGRLYSLLGFGYYDSHSDKPEKPGNRIANPFRTGIGIGYEWFTSEKVVVSLSGAITYFPSTGEVYPLPELGFFYYFR